MKSKLSFDEIKEGALVQVLKTRLQDPHNPIGYSETAMPNEAIGLLRTITYNGRNKYHVFEMCRDDRIVTMYQDVKTAEYRLLSNKDTETFLEFKKSVIERYPDTYLRVKPEGVFSGSDPEIFAVDENGTVIPAWKYLPNKNNAVSDYNNYAKAFWDGFQAEFTITPRQCHQEMMDNVHHGLKAVYDRLKQYNPKGRLVPTPVVDVPFEMMRAASNEHASLGCSPSENVYPDVEPIVVDEPWNLPYRFAGCHIHLGLPDKRKIKNMVKAMDAIFGVMTVAIFKDMEDPRRREFYGRAGEYRAPPHGLEYRVASSNVLCHPAVAHLCFDLARMSAAFAYYDLMSLWEYEEKQVREIINNCDYDEAVKLLNKNKSMVKAIISRLYPEYESRALKILEKGAKELLPVNDIEKVWFLENGFGYSNDKNGHIKWHSASGNANCQLKNTKF